MGKGKAVYQANSRIILVGCVLLTAAVVMSCAYIMSVSMELTGRVKLDDLPDGQWDGTRVELVGVEATFTDANGRYSFDGWVTNDHEWTLMVTRDGYDGWRVQNVFPYSKAKKQTGTTVVEVEELTLTRIGSR